ncbi:MAG: hypothetical protein O7E57_04510 [Gammaproteobacteria bacterium]|nr:hypothetical protein [Gammaproteobacteria bacterium]
MRAERSVTGLMTGLALLAMGCSSGQFQMNSNPDSGRSMPMVAAAGWNDPASQEFDASPDGRYMVVAGDESGVVVLDATTGDVVRQFDTEYRNVMVNYSSCGKLVAARDAKQVIRIWDVSTGRLVFERPM